MSTGKDSFARGHFGGSGWDTALMEGPQSAFHFDLPLPLSLVSRIDSDIRRHGVI